MPRVWPRLDHPGKSSSDTSAKGGYDFADGQQVKRRKGDRFEVAGVLALELDYLAIDRCYHYKAMFGRQNIDKHPAWRRLFPPRVNENGNSRLQIPGEGSMRVFEALGNDQIGKGLPLHAAVMPDDHEIGIEHGSKEPGVQQRAVFGFPWSGVVFERLVSFGNDHDRYEAFAA